MLYGAIEAGGTKMVCAVGDENGNLTERVTIPTGKPQETLGAMADYFQKWRPVALGIGCFGPLDLNPASPAYGFITKTTKPGWMDCDVAGYFERALGIPVGIDTDVNAAVLGEVTWGAASGCDTAIYITIGTGVGVGVYVNGGLLHGLVHPEAGHMLLTRHPEDSYEGCCPFHHNCVEGLASGPAIEGRFGKGGALLSSDKKVWELEAYYIGQAVTDYVLAYSPQKIILWGGVMHQESLFPLVREQVKTMLGGYVQHEMILTQIDRYIVPPALGEDPGIKGALRLAILEAAKKTKR